MGILDKSVSENDFKAFKSEVKKSLDALKKSIDAKVTDSEAEAAAAAQRTVASQQAVEAFAATIEESLTKIEGYAASAAQESEQIQGKRVALETTNRELLQKISDVQSVTNEITALKASVETSVGSVAADMTEIKEALALSADLPSQVESIKQLLTETASVKEKVDSLLNHSMKKKSDIDGLYDEINGSDVTNDANETEHVDGIKDDLEKTYDELESKVSSLSDTVKTAISGIDENHQQELGSIKDSFEKLLKDSKAKVSAVTDQLTGLLPGAMAEGLSAAYNAKKEDEVESLKAHEKKFQNAIRTLVGISLIPFCVDIYLLAFKESDLIQVIKDTPSLLVAILPLYLPVLWLAFSANKKLNLSKRLIEEYTHKAVLGRTFEGLSNQIETLPAEEGIRAELRTKLLFTLLQVSSENPGKLITNYEKSDHPLMEALESSSRLSDAVDSLAKLPGFSSLATKLSARSDKILKEEQRKVKEGLDVQDFVEGQ